MVEPAGIEPDSLSSFSKSDTQSDITSMPFPNLSQLRQIHLAMDTLVFRLQFLLTSLYRTSTDESTHMPRIPKENWDSVLID